MSVQRKSLSSVQMAHFEVGVFYCTFRADDVAYAKA